MTLHERIAGAPISWGVSEVPGWGVQLEPERVLGDMARVGLAATELGPDGYLPSLPDELRSVLDAHGLRLVGGFVTAALHDAKQRQAQLAQVRRQAGLIASAGGSVLVLAAVSGHDGYDARFELDDAGWAALGEGIAACEDVANGQGLELGLHPHVGTMIERAPDVERLLETTGARLCLDTGHMLIGGCDIPGVVERWADRIAHVHLKDVDEQLAALVRAGERTFAQAVADGLFVPLGEGGVDVPHLVHGLERAGYRGWYVLEQDVALDADSPSPAAHAAQSYATLLGVARAMEATA